MSYDCKTEMSTATNPTGYGPRRGFIFSGVKSKYKLWEVKFLAQMRLQKLYDVFVPGASKTEVHGAKKADAFAKLVQCLDDRSLVGNQRSKRRRTGGIRSLAAALSRQRKTSHNFSIHGINNVEKDE